MSAKSVAALVLLGVLAGLGLASLLQPNRSALGFQAATCPDIPLYLLVTATPHAPPPTGTETPTASATPPADTDTPTATETATASATASPSHTPTPTGTPTATGTETATEIPPPTDTPTVTPTAIPTLSPPTNIVAAPQQQRVALSWTWPTGASAVSIELFFPRTGWAQVLNHPSWGALPVLLSNLVCNTTYQFRLRAYRQSDGQYSDYAMLSVTTTACLPTPTQTATPTPTNTPTATLVPTDTPTPPPSPTAVWSNGVILNWIDNSTDESDFRIERSPDGTTWVEIATVAADVTTYTDHDPALQCGATYYYRVRAYRAADGQFSPYSGLASVDIPACDTPTPGIPTETGTPTNTPTSTPTPTSTLEPTETALPTPTYGPADVYHLPFSAYGCLSGSDAGWTPEPCPYGTPIPLARSGVPTDTLAVEAALLCENDLVYDFGARGDDRITSLAVYTTTMAGYETPEPTATLPLTPTPVANPTPTATPPPGSGTIWQFAGVVNGQTHVADFECWAGWDWYGMSILPYLRLDWLN